MAKNPKILLFLSTSILDFRKYFSKIFAIFSKTFWWKNNFSKMIIIRRIFVKKRVVRVHFHLKSFQYHGTKILKISQRLVVCVIFPKSFYFSLLGMWSGILVLTPPLTWLLIHIRMKNSFCSFHIITVHAILHALWIMQNRVDWNICIKWRERTVTWLGNFESKFSIFQKISIMSADKILMKVPYLCRDMSSHLNIQWGLEWMYYLSLSYHILSWSPSSVCYGLNRKCWIVIKFNQFWVHNLKKTIFSESMQNWIQIIKNRYYHQKNCLIWMKSPIKRLEPKMKH